jgi:hypothetical protein
MDVRQDDAGMATFFRSDRFFRINQHVYFQCRGNSTYGPYPDVKTANIMLSQFLAAKKQARKRPTPSSYKPIENSEAYSLISDTIEYDIFTPATKQSEEGSAYQASQEVATNDTVKKSVEVHKPIKKTEIISRAIVTQKTTVTKQKSTRTEITQANRKDAATIPSKKLPATETKRTPYYQVKFSPVRVEEYVAGAEIGYLQVTDEDEKHPFTYQVSDSRIEIIGRTLKLVDNQFFDCEADSPVVLTVLASNDQKKHCRKTIRINIDAISS